MNRFVGKDKHKCEYTNKKRKKLSVTPYVSLSLETPFNMAKYKMCIINFVHLPMDWISFIGRFFRLTAVYFSSNDC